MGQKTKVKRVQKTENAPTRAKFGSTFASEEAPTQAKPRFQSTFFESNHVSRNGNSTTLTKKVSRKDDSTETTITREFEDKEGNRKFENVAPNEYMEKLQE